ncbi:MAG: LUD domain-containing protein [Thermodesulfobacteriota bacterium]
MRNELVDTFVQNARKVAAEAFVVADDGELNRVLAQVLQPADRVYCPGVTNREKAVVFAPEQRCEDYRSATVCVEEVFAGVAETGSVVSSSGGGKAIQAGLVCAHHVAIVAQENVMESVADFFTQWGASPPTNITFETGPSRTADIELTLTIGVHGPGRLTVIVY